jgi:HPt (histidine-containing phosphotransfer) domain-containing protein
LEATAVIRAAEEEQGSARLPIVAMTAHALTGDRERCLEAGMDDYLPKPLNRQQLYEVVAHWTGTSAPLTPAAVDVASLSTPQAPKKKPVFDRVAALDRMADDEELLQEVIELFLEDMPKQVSLLQQHLDAGNVEEMGRTAHGVKGAAANIGAERVREAALLIEEAGKVGDLSLGVDLVAALRVDLEELAAQLRDGP